MSSEVFSRTESVFFVCDGENYHGSGCTLQYVLDNGGFAGFDKSKIMESDGSPIAESHNVTYSNSDGKIVEAILGDFDNAEVGMVLMITGSGFDSPGRYEITAVGVDKVTIEPGLDTGDVSGCHVFIGGAFDTLDHALDNLTANDAGGKHDCYLFTNQNETVTAQPAVNGGGNIEYNTKLFITGFNTTLLDMMPGGNYYQSVYDAYRDGIDAACHVAIDLNDINAFSVSASCVIVQNLRLTNIPTGDSPVYISSNIRGVIFENCILDNGNWIIYGEQNSTNIYFINCYMFGNTNTLSITDSGDCDFYFIGCIADMGSVDLAMFGASATDRLVVTGCLLIGSRRIFSGSGDFNEWNNTIIGHATNTDAVHRMNGATALRVGFGDIVVIPQGGNVADIGSSGGCVLWQDFQCIFGSDDAEYVGDYAINAKSGGGVNRRDFNTIDIDPLFEGEEDKNYNLDWRSPLIDTGYVGTLGVSSKGALARRVKRPFVHRNKGVL